MTFRLIFISQNLIIKPYFYQKKFSYKTHIKNPFFVFVVFLLEQKFYIFAELLQIK